MIQEQKQMDSLWMKYEFAHQKLRVELQILLDEFQHRNGYNPVEHIKSRVKTKESTYQKLERKGLKKTPSNILKYINDMVGIRIVCSFLTDVYDLVSLFSNSKNMSIQARKDYIKHPKNTGYMSYHLLVLVPIYLQTGVEHIKCEIQIRTIAMDFWASLDHKISYKFPRSIPKEIAKEMYEYSYIIKQLDYKMEKLNKIMNKYKKKRT